MAKHNTVTLLIIVCANLKAGADTVCLGVRVYIHIVVRARFDLM